MSDTSDSRAAAANASIPPSSHVEDTAGHGSSFVQPKTYLRPETRAMESKPLTPLDKEQMQGLVSGLSWQISIVVAIRLETEMVTDRKWSAKADDFGW